MLPNLSIQLTRVKGKVGSGTFFTPIVKSEVSHAPPPPGYQDLGFRRP